MSMDSPPRPAGESGADLRSIRADTVVLARSLDAQAALLPYALMLFGICLPIFLWAATFADNAAWALASLAIFAINWGVYYAVVSVFRREPALPGDVARRTRLTIMSGLLWSIAVAQISIFALGAGPARESLLVLAAGAAVICIVFNAPSLAGLLIIGFTAPAGPLIGLFLHADTRHIGGLAWGAIALAVALSMVLNRILVRQFALTAERERLVQARADSLERAEQLANSKSALLATLGHEIRDGLTGVVHVLAAAAAGGRTGPSREQLGTALAAARDLVGVLETTLDSEQADAGGLSVATAPLDCVALANELLTAHRPLAAAKGLELALHIDSELEDAAGGALMGDAARVRQVMGGLIVNAIGYTLRGRVEIRVRRLGADRMRFEVADTGPGLTADELDLAFEAFSRVHRTSAGSSGAGLGLSLARRLARLMGGDVTADSAAGVGSCFNLDLPYDGLRARVFDPDIQVAGGSAPSRGLRIFLADGDGLNAAMIRAALEQLGHKVIQAHKAARLSELLRICEVDLVLAAACDTETPAAATIRLVRGLSQAPIVALIDGEAAEAVECQGAGAALVLRRPITVTALARALSSFDVGEVPRSRAVA